MQVRAQEQLAVVVLLEPDDTGYHHVPTHLVERWVQAWQELAAAEDEVVSWLEQTDQYPPDSL
jgi:hypothetical protein